MTFSSLAATGIVAMLRTSNRRALSMLKHVAFLDELKRACNCSVAQIAGDLGRSKGWVSVRLGLFSQMSEGVRRKLFAGVFPVYAYMYTLRPFMRMDGGAEQVERFVGAVSGHGCSEREIELLAQGYFRGPEAARRHIEQGRVPAVLEELRPAPAGRREGCGAFEAGACSPNSKRCKSTWSGCAAAARTSGCTATPSTTRRTCWRRASSAASRTSSRRSGGCMIGEDQRKAIVLLHEEGMELRAIARRPQVSRNTVPARVRSDKLAHALR